MNGSLEPMGAQNDPQQNVCDGQQLSWQSGPAFGGLGQKEADSMKLTASSRSIPRMGIPCD